MTLSPYHTISHSHYLLIFILIGTAHFFMEDTVFLKCQKSSLTPGLPSFKFSSSAGSLDKAGGADAALGLYHGKSFVELIPHGLLQGEVPLSVCG